MLNSTVDWAEVLPVRVTVKRKELPSSDFDWSPIDRPVSLSVIVPVALLSVRLPPLALVREMLKFSSSSAVLSSLMVTVMA